MNSALDLSKTLTSPRVSVYVLKIFEGSQENSLFTEAQYWFNTGPKDTDEDISPVINNKILADIALDRLITGNTGLSKTLEDAINLGDLQLECLKECSQRNVFEEESLPIAPQRPDISVVLDRIPANEKAKAPAAWTCDPSFFAANDGCDCNCGTVDPDYDFSEESYGYSGNQTCRNGGFSAEDDQDIEANFGEGTPLRMLDLLPIVIFSLFYAVLAAII